jgi:hypothetical protein
MIIIAEQTDIVHNFNVESRFMRLYHPVDGDEGGERAC